MVKVSANPVSDKGLLLVAEGCLLANLHIVESRQASSLSSSDEGANPIHGDSILNHLPKSSPPNIIILGVRFQHVDFEQTKWLSS